MSETLRKDIDRLWITCKTMLRHLKNQEKSHIEKNLLQRDLMNLANEFGKLQLLMGEDQIIIQKNIRDKVILDKFKEEYDLITLTVRESISTIRRHDYNAVYLNNKQSIDEIELRLDNLIGVLIRLKEFNESFIKEIKLDEKKLKNVEKLVA